MEKEKIEKLAEIEYGNHWRFQERAAFIKGYEKANEWISVKDRLPERKPKLYITSTVNGFIFVLTFLSGEWVDLNNQPFKVTHWKHLPNPPKH